MLFDRARSADRFSARREIRSSSPQQSLLLYTNIPCQGTAKGGTILGNSGAGPTCIPAG
jgi:hypothetical protein